MVKVLFRYRVERYSVNNVSIVVVEYIATICEVNMEKYLTHNNT